MSEVANSYHTVSEIENLIHQFNQCTLQRCQWHHHAHLVVALWYLIHYDQKQAIHLIRQGIQRYNKAININTTQNSGYHETITLFWIYQVICYLANSKNPHVFFNLANDLVHAYSNQNLIFQYYSRELLMSWEARTGWIEPDLQPINSEILMLN